MISIDSQPFIHGSQIFFQSSIKETNYPSQLSRLPITPAIPRGCQLIWQNFTVVNYLAIPYRCQLIQRTLIVANNSVIQQVCQLILHLCRYILIFPLYFQYSRYIHTFKEFAVINKHKTCRTPT